MMPDVNYLPDSLYSVLMQQAKQPFLVLEQFMVQEGNANAAHLLGVTLTELSTRSLWSFCPLKQANGGDSPEIWQAYQNQALAGEAVRFEWQFQHSDGHLIQACVKLSHWQRDGNVRILVFIQDSDQQQCFESELQAARFKFQTLLENFPGGITMIDQSLRFIAWNQTAMRLTGFTEEFFVPGTQPSVSDMFRYNIVRGEYGEVSSQMDMEALLHEKMEAVKRFEAHHFIRVRPDGLVLEVRGIPMENGGFVTTYQDVTEQYHVKEQVRQQSVLLSEVLEHMSPGVMLFDENLCLKAWNSNAIKMLELPLLSIQPGVPFADLMRVMLKEGVGWIDADFEHRLRRNIKFMRESSEHHSEQTNAAGRTFLIHGKTLKNTGKMVELIITMTDITERKQVEVVQYEANLRLEKLVKELNEARADLVRNEKLAGLGSLVTGVAHELNTPLDNCLMMTGAIQDATRRIDEKVKSNEIVREDLDAYFNHIMGDMHLLTKNLLTAAELIMRFKQVAITQTNTQRRVFYLHELIHEVELVMCEKIQDAGHHLEVQVPPDIRFDSYPDPLEQVMISLINNALQHAFEGIQGGKMTLLAHKVSEEQIRIEFHDNGKGIAAQYLARIFDPFFTINNNRGCGGLGLHISHNIVTSLLSGGINVQSEVGGGTAFVLELPLNTPVKY